MVTCYLSSGRCLASLGISKGFEATCKCAGTSDHSRSFEEVSQSTPILNLCLSYLSWHQWIAIKVNSSASLILKTASLSKFPIFMQATLANPLFQCNGQISLSHSHHSLPPSQIPPPHSQVRTRVDPGISTYSRTQRWIHGTAEALQGDGMST